MGLVIVSTIFLLVFNWLFSEIFVFVPLNSLGILESLWFYVFIAIGILLVSWIVGD